MNKRPLSYESDIPEWRIRPRLREYAWYYLTADRPAPIDVDPQRDFGIHPDDMPAGWQHPAGQQFLDNGDVTAARRSAIALNTAADYVRHALTIAGYTSLDAQTFAPAAQTFQSLDRTVRAMWEYRRFGIPIRLAHQWHDHHLAPPIARVYADAGYPPAYAARLDRFIVNEAHHYAARHHMSLIDYRAHLALICLDYRIDRHRAAAYMRAGVQHHEIPDLETRHKSGEDVIAGLQLLNALNP